MPSVAKIFFIRTVCSLLILMRAHSGLVRALGAQLLRFSFQLCSVALIIFVSIAS